MRKTDKTREIERKRVTSGYHGGSISRLQKKKKKRRRQRRGKQQKKLSLLGVPKVRSSTL